jgi:FkbM family methyltransferase
MLELIVRTLMRYTRIPGRQRIARWLYPISRQAKRYVLGVRARGDGLLMQLDSRNHIDWATLFYGDFEPEITRLIRGCLAPGSIFVDIGANIGCHTLTAASLVGELGQVFAFEPNPPIRELLENNLRLNQLERRVSVYACGLGSTPTRLSLRVPTPGSLEESNMGLASFVALETPHDLIEVEVNRLDDVLPPENLSRCDLIKMDVQGYEAQVLAGMQQMLATHHPIVVFEYENWAWQMAGADLIEVATYLRDLEYSLHQIDIHGKLHKIEATGNLNQKFGHANLIAYPTEKPQ